LNDRASLRFCVIIVRVDSRVCRRLIWENAFFYTVRKERYFT